MLFVSHNMAAVQSLCSRVVVLENGEKSFEGHVDGGIDHYMQTGQAETGLPLGELPDRSGNQRIRLTDIRFLDGQSGETLTVLISGRPVRIELSYETHDPAPDMIADVSIGFFTPFGVLLCACRSAVVGTPLKVEAGGGKWTCSFDKWPLTSGVYTLNIMSRCNGEIADWIREAGSVRVETGDFYGSGTLPAEGMSSVLTEYSWDAA